MRRIQVVNQFKQFLKYALPASQRCLGEPRWNINGVHASKNLEAQPRRLHLQCIEKVTKIGLVGRASGRYVCAEYCTLPVCSCEDE